MYSEHMGNTKVKLTKLKKDDAVKIFEHYHKPEHCNILKVHFMVKATHGEYHEWVINEMRNIMRDDFLKLLTSDKATHRQLWEYDDYDEMNFTHRDVSIQIDFPPKVKE